jgi:hypothetical protein
MEHFFVKPSFYKDYQKLRKQFESNFKDPKSTHQKRFVWDFWYDEDQYHLIRTPAFYYFQKKVYQDFHSYLVQWGRENLGCHDISPPWLSYYVDGCYQNLHSDVPHGPWAFVYSLTPNKKDFRGGETLILKPKTLNYWADFNESKQYEYDSFVDRVPSKMNQLILFDPRFPHGVSEVKGTRDPLKSRLVIHGWFVNPRPYVVGGLSTAQVQKALDPAFHSLMQILSQIELLNGAVSIRLKVSKSGRVLVYKLLTNTLISQKSDQADLYLLKELRSIFKFILFPKSKTESQITIPLLFKS